MEDLCCSRCGRRGTAADVAAGWSLDTPPRPTGAVGTRSTEVTALCPDCTRRHVRDLEARLDL